MNSPHQTPLLIMSRLWQQCLGYLVTLFRLIEVEFLSYGPTMKYNEVDPPPVQPLTPYPDVSAEFPGVTLERHIYQLHLLQSTLPNQTGYS